MVRQTLIPSKEGRKRIQTAIKDRQWKISERDTRPLISACYRYIEEYQKKHQLSNNDSRWLKDFEQIFRVERDEDQTKEQKQEKLDKIKRDILKNNQITFVETIKTLIDSGEIFVQNISWGTWSRFASYKNINVNAFKIYCAILDLDWQEIQEITEQSPHFYLSSNLDELLHQSIFYGRKTELSQLSEWLNKQTKVIFLSGIAGIGKTTLIMKLLEKINDEFECILYKDLSNLQSFSQFYRDLNENNIDYIGNVKPIIDYLSHNRCLLILDNWQELLQSDGSYDKEYQEYKIFLNKIAQENHQSSVIVIGQEKPSDFEVWLMKNILFEIMELLALDEESAINILEDQGFAKGSQDLKKLIKLYGYHPGVIQLVGKDIKQEFNGNILQYLSQSSLIVSDVIGNYIIQIFNKLLAKEIDIIYFLSIVTESLSQEQLKIIFYPYLSGTEILNGIKSLKRRSLFIETTNNLEITYSMQPFIKKYVSNQFIEEICEEIIAVITNEKLAEINFLRTHPLVYPNQRENLINRKIANRIIEKLIPLSFPNNLSSQLLNVLSRLDEHHTLALGYLKNNLSYLLSVINDTSR